MIHPVAQIAALTCHANAFLQDYRPVSFPMSNSTAQFCKAISFKNPLSFFSIGKVLADNPDAWFRQLKRRHAIGVQLTRRPGLPTPLAASFIDGGGSWCMEVYFPNRVDERWYSKWTVTDQNAADKRIWSVEYNATTRLRLRKVCAPDLHTITETLEASLRNIHTFAQRHSLRHFVENFGDALNTIQTRGNARHGYHQDLAPAGFLSDSAAILLDASQKAWVFGGMGSWNDLAFEGEEQQSYEKLSKQLLSAMNQAIAGAASSTFRS